MDASGSQSVRKTATGRRVKSLREIAIIILNENIRATVIFHRVIFRRDAKVKLISQVPLFQGCSQPELARIAGIMAAKRTHELIPLCHPLSLTEVTVDFEPVRDPPGIRVEASAKVDAKTGVEMEALTAVSIACLTIYDMVKAVDRAMSFSGIRLVEKTGGRSGHFKR